MGARRRRGYRLPPNIVRSLRGYFAAGLEWMTLIASPNLEPDARGSGASPLALVGEERVVAKAQALGKKNGHLFAVERQMGKSVGTERADAAMRTLRAAYGATDFFLRSGDRLEKLEPMFGDVAGLVLGTTALRARAKTAWPQWVLALGPWRTSENARRTAGALEAYYRSAMREAYALADAREQTGWPTSVQTILFNLQWEAIETRRRDGDYLDDIAIDVLLRALDDKTRDDVLLFDVRREADQSLSEASLLLLDAWYEVDLDSRSEAKRAKVKEGRAGLARMARLAAVTGLPPPTTNDERIAALEGLLARMRRQDDPADAAE